ncbi:MAG: sulfite exporter TauE/SafE family protein [Pseudomonadota bacterium]
MTNLLAFYQSMGPALVLLVLVVFTLAGTVKGVIGLGLPTVTMGLLGLAMPASQAAALLIMPSTLTNLWQLSQGGPLHALLKRLWPMLLAVCIGTLVGNRWFGLGTGPWVTHALGGALLAYALIGLYLPSLRLSSEREAWMGPLCGLLTGLVTAATGVFVIPAVPYLQALGLDRDAMVQALGLSFTVSTLALASGLFSGGLLDGGLLGASLVLVLPALAGMALGQWLRQRISPAAFKRLFFIGMALLGGHLLVNG